MLREARESLGIDMADVHDRTGVSWRYLEALEAGDTERFSDASAAATAMRRYADLVGLDHVPLVGALSNTTQTAARTGARGGPGVASGRASGVVPAQTGHLRRYDAREPTHLRSFTETAQVPAVGGSGASGLPVPTIVRPRPKAPLGLRLLTWLVLVLVVLAAGGLAVDHYKPQWLRAIHVLKSPHHVLAAGPPQKHHKKIPTTTTTKPADLISTSNGANGAMTIDVAAPDFTVVVGASNEVWVEASTPTSARPLVNQVLQPLQSVRIPVSGNDQLDLELGSQNALITIEVAGETVSGWSLKPSIVPFDATFESGNATNTSTSTSSTATQ